MPYKHNDSRRHKLEKAKYKVTNWSEYNDALRKQGDITVWHTLFHYPYVAVSV